MILKFYKIKQTRYFFNRIRIAHMIASHSKAKMRFVWESLAQGHTIDNGKARAHFLKKWMTKWRNYHERKHEREDKLITECRTSQDYKVPNAVEK